MGHTGQRLEVFARKAAPFQVTWLGYVGTTGMAAMDGLVADAIHVRPGEEPYYVERVLRMPNGYACYAAPRDAPEVGELPALASGQVTFGCFNNPAKFTSAMLDAWAAILLRVPGSRLLLKFYGLDDDGVRAGLEGQFTRRGVASERVILEGQAEHRDFLEGYSRVDLALDTQPYSGGLTTCEALWMGVPVVTFPGRTFAGRHAASHLTHAGFPHFVARDLSGYVELAVSWARQPEALAIVRERMREQMLVSPLCNAERFARDFLDLLREAGVYT
jgi:predicted O-linked N-acetylglucosamine transferase (SPINDLY family)